jgi:hypothetical protein
MQVFDYNDSTIQDIIFFENGTSSNLMSYITPDYDNVSSRNGLSSEQIDKMRFGANTPTRLLLRNHCLGTSLCDGWPEQTDPSGEEETLEELDNEHTEGNSTPVIEMIATIIAILLIIPGWAVALLAIFAYFVRKSRKEN